MQMNPHMNQQYIMSPWLNRLDSSLVTVQCCACTYLMDTNFLVLRDSSNEHIQNMHAMINEASGVRTSTLCIARHRARLNKQVLNCVIIKLIDSQSASF